MGFIPVENQLCHWRRKLNGSAVLHTDAAALYLKADGSILFGRRPALLKDVRDRALRRCIRHESIQNRLRIVIAVADRMLVAVGCQRLGFQFHLLFPIWQILQNTIEEIGNDRRNQLMPEIIRM